MGYINDDVREAHASRRITATILETEASVCFMVCLITLGDNDYRDTHADFQLM